MTFREEMLEIVRRDYSPEEALRMIDRDEIEKIHFYVSPEHRKDSVRVYDYEPAYEPLVCYTHKFPVRIDWNNANQTGYPSLRSLGVDFRNVKRLPVFNSYHAKFIWVGMEECPELKAIPPEIGCLNSLEGLVIDAKNLKELPKEIGQLEHLILLSIADTVVENLPSSIIERKPLFVESTDHISFVELIGDIRQDPFQIVIGKNCLPKLDHEKLFVSPEYAYNYLMDYYGYTPTPKQSQGGSAMYQNDLSGSTFNGPVTFYQGTQQAGVNDQLKQIQALLANDDARLQQKFEELKAELKEPPKKDRKAFWDGVFSLAKNGVEIAASLTKIFASAK